jgi:metal-responsive CopG/Arc/MetJ family transcriptional regulator
MAPPKRQHHGERCALRLPAVLRDKIDELAAKDFETRSNVIRRLIRAGLDEVERGSSSAPRSRGWQA